MSEEAPQVETPEPCMDIDEAVSILRAANPGDSFHVELSAWAHDHSNLAFSPALTVDITISVWSSALQRRFQGVTLREAVARCREAVTEAKARQTEDAHRRELRRTQFSTAAQQIERRLRK